MKKETWAVAVNKANGMELTMCGVMEDRDFKEASKMALEMAMENFNLNAEDLVIKETVIDWSYKM